MHVGYGEHPGQRVHSQVEYLVCSLGTVHVTQETSATLEHRHHLDVSVGGGGKGREGEGRGREWREGDGRGGDWRRSAVCLFVLYTTVVLQYWIYTSYCIWCYVDKEAHFFCFFWMYFRCENSVFSLKVALFSITLSTMT